jgi:hypothetical protein
MSKTQTFAVAMLLAAMFATAAAAQTYPGGGSLGVTGSDNVRLTLFNAVPPASHYAFVYAAALPTRRAGTRQMLLPVLKHLSGLTCLGVPANIELYDSVSARTFAFVRAIPVLPIQ